MRGMPKTFTKRARITRWSKLVATAQRQVAADAKAEVLVHGLSETKARFKRRAPGNARGTDGRVQAVRGLVTDGAGTQPHLFPDTYV